MSTTKQGTFVSIEDLGMMRDAISVARNLGQANDVVRMVELQMDNAPWSPYTKAMQEALDRAEGLYRQAAAEEYDRMMEEEEDGDDTEVVDEED